MTAREWALPAALIAASLALFAWSIRLYRTETR